MSILKAFNNHLTDFFGDMLLVYPDDQNIKTAKFYVANLIKVNPALLIKGWDMYITQPYQQDVAKGDFRFFLDKDYKKDIGVSDNYSTENVLEAIDIIRRKSQGMSADNKTKIVKYVQNLTKLSVMYKNKV